MSNYRSNRNTGINPVWVIIGVNFVIFLATFVSGHVDVILDGHFFRSLNVITYRFGLTPSLLTQQPWNILTYMFVHEEIMHIAFNMLTLYFFASFVMSLVGETTFLITYFVGGIFGGLFYIVLSSLLGNPSPVIGASGAIYALGGLLMVMRPNVKVMTFPIPVPMPLWVAILVGFVLVSFIPGVAWEAHLGGLVYGAAVGYYFRRREFRRY